MRQESNKQADKMLTAHIFTLERNLRILEMKAAAQNQDIPEKSTELPRHPNSAVIDHTNQVIVPIFTALNPLIVSL